MWFEDVMRKHWQISAAAGTIVIIIIMAAILSSSLNPPGGVTPASQVVASIPGGMKQVNGTSKTVTGYANEKSKNENTVNITDKNISQVKITLTWTDEADKPLMKNQPDEFKVEAIAPNNQTNASGSVKNEQGKPGSITIIAGFAPQKFPDTSGTGEWKINVYAGDCGDQTGMFIGLIKSPDTGNDWQLKIDYTYFVANNTK